jgi:hypothetical protein
MNPHKTYSSAVNTWQLGGWKLSVQNKVVSVAVRHLVGKLQLLLLPLVWERGGINFSIVSKLMALL